MSVIRKASIYSKNVLKNRDDTFPVRVYSEIHRRYISSNGVLRTLTMKIEVEANIGIHPQHYTGQQPRTKFEFTVP
jgi:hypothetical protein